MREDDIRTMKHLLRVMKSGLDENLRGDEAPVGGVREIVQSGRWQDTVRPYGVTTILLVVWTRACPCSIRMVVLTLYHMVCHGWVM